MLSGLDVLDLLVKLLNPSALFLQLHPITNLSLLKLIDLLSELRYSILHFVYGFLLVLRNLH